MSAPEPGWYPDPRQQPETYRWWDGARWTKALTHDREAPSPELIETTGVDEGAPPAADLAPQLPPGYVPGYPLPRSAQAQSSTGRTARLPIVLGIGALVVVLAVVGGIVFWRTNPTTKVPELAPPAVSASPQTALHYDPATGQVEIAELKATMPRAPWECEQSTRKATSLFSEGLFCSAEVHKDYAAGDTWYATAGMGLADPSLVAAGDIDQTASNVFKALSIYFFSDVEVTVSNQKAIPLNITDPTLSAVGLQAEVNYSIKGLASTSDHVTIVVVELLRGGYGVWLASRPDDTPKPMMDSLVASLNSIRAR